MHEERAVLHADVDAFFASVEQRDDPRLRGRPVIVGSGVVMAASYEARAWGVHGAMGGARARALCPPAVVVEPRFSAYVEASRALFEVFEQAAPLVEGLSMEEAFLDVTGLGRISGSPGEIAARLRRDVRRLVGLPITVGAARTKALAKVASGVAKPDGLLVLAPERELSFLHALPVERLWGVGPATAEKLHGRGLATVGQLAALTEADLVSILGRASGRHLHALARNRDPRRVRTGRRRRSIGSQCALGREPLSPEALDVVVIAVADRVSRRVRAAGWVGRTVVLRLRFRDFKRATRSRTLRRPTASTRVILAVARALLEAASPMISRRGVTLVGLTVTGLEHARAGRQLELPLDGADSAALDAAVDEVRDRFGIAALTRAALLDRGRRSVPSLLTGED